MARRLSAGENPCVRPVLRRTTNHQAFPPGPAPSQPGARGPLPLRRVWHDGPPHDRTPAGLDIHAVLDNYATHKTDAVVRWLARHPRWHLHFIPTHSSWLNQVERFFAELTRKRLQRESFLSVAQLRAAILMTGAVSRALPAGQQLLLVLPLLPLVKAAP